MWSQQEDREGVIHSELFQRCCSEPGHNRQTSLELEEGYELVVKSVDIDGNKVYLELYKDGELIDSRGDHTSERG